LSLSWSISWTVIIYQSCSSCKILDKEIDATQLAFEFNSLELGANWAFQLYGDARAFKRAREAIRERLSRHATAAGAPLLALGKPRTVRARA
jgi:FPC/CPF motif-containing protein YcgG